jgi:hypothetical protein
MEEERAEQVETVYARFSPIYIFDDRTPESGILGPRDGYGKARQIRNKSKIPRGGHRQRHVIRR